MNPTVDKRNLLLEFQEMFHRSGSGKSPAQRHAMNLLVEKGLPGPKSEEYKFTPVARYLEKITAIREDTSDVDSAPLLPIQLLEDVSCNVVAFVNGRYSARQSVLLDSALSIRVTPGADPVADGDAFGLLNQAFGPETIDIDVSANQVPLHPLAVVHYYHPASATFGNPRWHCRIGSNSNLTLLEYSRHGQEAACFNNHSASIEVGENASLEYVTIQNGPKQEVHVTNTRVTLAAYAKATCFTFTFDGQLVRNNLTLSVDGPGVDAHLFGLYLLTGSTLADNHTVVDHRQPNSFSNELYKGIMDGNSKGVFNGKIYVRPLAQKTNAFQSNRNILLSETATVDTKPQLEIWADDVKCSHGCTTGQLDEEAIFYLRTRGISKEVARGMVLYAFALDTLASMKHEGIRTFVEKIIAEKLQKGF